MDERAVVGGPGEKRAEAFRDYGAAAPVGVRELYRQNHRLQTLELVRAKEREFLGLDHAQMSVWEAMEHLEALVDESDPDTDLPQSVHAYQTAEAIRAAGLPPWMQLAGFIHDLGKVLCLFGEPQWAVVGDTFPVGCAFSDRIVYPELFEENPDRQDPVLGTHLGIYEEGCGLERVHMSWGHDEYLYHVVKDHLPAPALAIIRYHSFYAAHRDGAYGHLMNEADRERFVWVQRFNPFDLYSKDAPRPDAAALAPYYRALVDEHLPGKLRW